jgi:hypothetical protein
MVYAEVANADRCLERRLGDLFGAIATLLSSVEESKVAYACQWRRTLLMTSYDLYRNGGSVASTTVLCYRPLAVRVLCLACALAGGQAQRTTRRLRAFALAFAFRRRVVSTVEPLRAHQPITSDTSPFLALVEECSPGPSAPTRDRSDSESGSHVSTIRATPDHGSA